MVQLLPATQGGTCRALELSTHSPPIPGPGVLHPGTQALGLERSRPLQTMQTYVNFSISLGKRASSHQSLKGRNDLAPKHKNPQSCYLVCELHSGAQQGLKCSPCSGLCGRAPRGCLCADRQRFAFHREAHTGWQRPREPALRAKIHLYEAPSQHPIPALGLRSPSKALMQLVLGLVIIKGTVSLRKESPIF